MEPVSKKSRGDTEPNESGEAKLWGGRFSGKTDPVMEKFNASIGFDKRVWKEDITGSRAYVKGLLAVKLIDEEEGKLLIDGLDEIEKEWAEGIFVIKPSDEDIHTANERRLKELKGEVAGKLHTGRSRNDQATTDIKLWLLSAIKDVKKLVIAFVEQSANRAQEEIDILMPGYTHSQRAQPIRWSHWIMCYCESLLRDLDRLQETERRASVLTLGSGALAGNALGIDRHLLAKELSFPEVSHNSLDATMDRDFVVDFLYWASMTLIHLSRWAEDLIIYGTKEFGFISLSDAYSTGSSLMPQKKNSDSLELIRGKAGIITGKLTGFMMTYKGLPSTYNKDLQEDKVALFETYDTVCQLLHVARGVIATLTMNEDRCRAALSPDMLATDLAYYLTRKGMPFRQAHEISGRCVSAAEDRNISLSSLPLDVMAAITPLFTEDVKSVWDYEHSVEQYTSTGGTAKQAVLDTIDHVHKVLKQVPI